MDVGRVDYKMFSLLLLSTLSSSQRIVFPDHTETEKTTDGFQIKRSIAGDSLVRTDPEFLGTIQDIFRTEDGDYYNYDGSGDEEYLTDDEIDHGDYLDDPDVEPVNLTIKKCCGPTEVLDEWYRCVERGNIDEFIANSFGYQQSEISFEYYNFKCPHRIVNEYIPLNILDGFIEIEIDENKTEVLEDYHCLDETELSENISEGLHLVLCEPQGESSGYLTKCCSPNEILSHDLESCVPNPDPTTIKTSTWIPPRMVLSHLTFRPTGQFHLQRSDFPDICPAADFRPLTPGHLFTDGRATAVSETEGYQVIAYSCMDRTISSQGEITDIALLVCYQPNITNIAKCCEDHQLLEDGKCVDNWDLLSPRISLPESLQIGLGLSEVKTCHQQELTQLELEYLQHRSLLPLTKDDLCLDVNRAGDTVIYGCERVVDLITCQWDALKTVYALLGVLSLLCLLLIVYVYVRIKETEKIQGKIILANVAATFLVNLYFLVVYKAKDIGKVSCLLLGYFGYFSTLAMFSWMSVMCFNLVRTFVKLSLHEGSQRRRFIFYSSFASGLPLLMTSIAGILQASLSDESDFNPSIGVTSKTTQICFIDDSGYKQLIFFHLPVFLLMILNVFGFLFTLILVNKARRRVRARASRHEDNRDEGKFNEEAKEQMLILVKMFLALGLPWILESIHYSAHRDHSIMENRCTEPSEILFRILSVLYYSRGIILFLIFVCKRSVWMKLKRTDPFRRLVSKVERRRRRTEIVKSGETLISMIVIKDNA